MISAHISYWTSAHFSTFVLTQLFADLTDRTTPTVVPEMAPPNEAGNERAQEEDEESRSNAE